MPRIKSASLKIQEIVEREVEKLHLKSMEPTGLDYNDMERLEKVTKISKINTAPIKQGDKLKVADKDLLEDLMPERDPDMFPKRGPKGPKDNTFASPQEPAQEIPTE